MGCLDEFTGNKRSFDSDFGWSDSYEWESHQNMCSDRESSGPAEWSPDGSTTAQAYDNYGGRTVEEVASGPGYGGVA